MRSFRGLAAVTVALSLVALPAYASGPAPSEEDYAQGRPLPEDGTAMRATGAVGATGTESGAIPSGVLAPQPAADQTAARKEYDERYVHFLELYLINVDTGQIAGRSMHGLKGKYDEPLKGAKYYDYVGRPDLAKKYRTRNGIRWGLVGGGGTLFIVGTSVGTLRLLNSIDATSACGTLDDGDPTSAMLADTCREGVKPVRNQAIGLFVMGGIGMVATIAGFFINPHPVKSQTEFIKLGEKFNEELRNKVGLRDLAHSNNLGARLLGNMRFDFDGGPTSAGLVLRSRF